MFQQTPMRQLTPLSPIYSNVKNQGKLVPFHKEFMSYDELHNKEL